MSEGFDYKKKKKSSSQFCKSVSTPLTRFAEAKVCVSLKFWVGLKTYVSLSLLTTEVTADVPEILSVISEIVFNTWAIQSMTQIRIVILQMFVPLGVLGGYWHASFFSCEPSVWQIVDLGISRIFISMFVIQSRTVLLCQVTALKTLFFFFFKHILWTSSELVCMYDMLKACLWKDKESLCYFNVAMQ